jgi:class 3 adenylate cyclase
MFAPPRTRYARNGDVNIAYQVVGDGPIDLLFVPGWFSHLDFFWELPASRAFFGALAKFSRLIVYDKRGTGLSDAADTAGSYADRIDDMRAVMSAAGADRPVVCGLSEGGAAAALFAAAEPDRVRSLILINAPTSQEDVRGMREWREQIAGGWGEGVLFERFLPELPDTPETRETWARTQRLSASRGLALQYYEQLLRIESRSVLPLISARTLVLRGSYDEIIDPDAARRQTECIPDAELKELPFGHIPWIVGGRRVVAAIEEFATGTAPSPTTDRRLATVLFTDIVDSTHQAAALGDRRWRDLLDQHDDALRAEIERFRGRVVKGTGDGFLAVFDGPTEAIDCALAARAAASTLGIRIRAGAHMGQCEFRGEDLAGIAVHIGARVAALAGPDEILVSRTVRDLVTGSDIALEDRGEHELKGVPDAWRVFAVA